MIHDIMHYKPKMIQYCELYLSLAVFYNSVIVSTIAQHTLHTIQNSVFKRRQRKGRERI